MLGISGAFNFMIAFTAEPIDASEVESQNYGYKFGQEEETCNIVAAHGYFGRLVFQYARFNHLH